MAPQYPLQQLLQIKRTRVEEAERVLADRRKALELEEENLRKAEEARQRVKMHYQETLQALREGMDTASMPPAKITHTKDYLIEVREKLKQEDKKVKDQERVVEAAQKQVDEAKKVLRQRRLEVEKLELHEGEWRKGVTLEELRLEGIEIDDLGTAMFNTRKDKRDG